ncbi:MAG: hypothetical protein BWY28_00140 [bacterium ADurb.Bin236]|nr:MAG: hypothetical protein BWY28_00140 [bacterium ADurb.Bin236]HOY63326.1 nuclear transport factor 2 family protein [bacterium]
MEILSTKIRLDIPLCLIGIKDKSKTLMFFSFSHGLSVWLAFFMVFCDISNSAAAVDMKAVSALEITRESLANTDLEFLDDVIVKVYSPSLVLLAEGKMEQSKTFSIEVPGLDDYEWLYVEIGEQESHIYGIFNIEEGVVVDYVTSTIMEAMLKMKTRMENITFEEMKHILYELHKAADADELSKAKNDSDAIRMLFSDEEYRLMLGDMAISFSTPGNTLEEYVKLNETMSQGISLFGKGDVEALKMMLTVDAKIEIDGQTVTGDQIIDSLRSLRNKYEVLKWDASCERIIVNENRAEVETLERIILSDKTEGSITKNIRMGFVNIFVKNENQWKLQERRMKKCEPASALIFADGSSADWTGIRPCVSKFTSKSGLKGEKAELSSIYMAFDDHGIFWRLENTNNLFEESFGDASAALIDETTHVMYVVSLLNEVSGKTEEGVHSWTGVNAGKEYSMNETSMTAPDGFNEKMRYLPDNFHVGASFAEGTLSKKEIKGLNKTAFLNARIIIDRGDGKTEVLSEGVPIEFEVPLLLLQ